jgi:hypothetical protein
VKTVAVVALMCGSACFGQALPGTQPLTLETDFVDRMLEGMDRWLLRELAASRSRRDSRDAPSEQGRKRFTRIIGVVDSRVAFDLTVHQIVTVLPKLSADQVQGFFQELRTLDPRIARTIVNAALAAADPAALHNPVYS